jgi:hypothetical protein
MTTLQEKRIKNYLRKQVSYNNDNNIRNKLVCLFYSNIDDIPIQKELTEEEYKNYLHFNFPDYFKEIDKNKIIEIFNTLVSPRKPIIISDDKNKNKNNYDINDDDKNQLEISLETFRPYYYHDWKKKTEELNKTSYENQYSFYNDYLRCFIKNKKFPTFKEFMTFIYNKNKVPLHKDIKNAFINIEKSYEPVKEYIKENQLTYKEVKEIIILSTNISNRRLMQIA